MSNNKSNEKVLVFFALVLICSIPLYGLNYLNLKLPFDLPPSVVMILVPMLVAVFLTYSHEKNGMMKLLNVFDASKIKDKRLIFVSCIIVPVFIVIMYVIVGFQGITSRVTPNYWIMIPVGFAVFFVGAIFEEVGWNNYATRRLAENHSVLFTGFVTGFVWEVWHLIPFIMMGRSNDWIIYQSLVGIGLRIIIVYLYTKSNQTIFPALIIHSMLNLAPELLPGGYESYSPAILASLIWLTIIGVAVWYKFKP